ncbi:TM2 domain-containing protein 3 isoform X1 [Pseudorca crassidens]|uniref:TM2 domain-containing protein 3 isoform X1 n=1 Tax=Pseudorca crassidens TaxID=82174 RepID=UPI00352C7B04
MARAGVLLWNLRRLCRVLLFLSQFYILSGGGSFSVEPSQPLAQSDKDPGPTRTFTVVPRAAESTDIPPYMMKCPSNGLCSKLPADCIECKTNFSCVYGKPVTFDCTVKPSVTCVDQDFKSQKSFVLNMTCRFCWQLPETDYECSSSTSCMAVSCPRQRYTANCTVRDHVHCLGNRTFPKMLYCNWTGGYKWSTALALRKLISELSTLAVSNSSAIPSPRLSGFFRSTFFTASPGLPASPPRLDTLTSPGKTGVPS